MEVIGSRDNKTFKGIKKLLSRKYRESEGLFLAEGPNIVAEAIRDVPERVRMIVLEEGSELPEAGGIPDTVRTIVLSEKLFGSVSDTETSQGVIAVVATEDTDDSEEDRNGGMPEITMVLDRLQDPGNIGTIIRTAEAAGIRRVLFVTGTADPYSPKVVRACAGALFREKILFTGSASGTIALLRKEGASIAVTDMAGEETVFSDKYREAASGKLAVVIGNEGNGVSDEFRAAADIKVRIPMKGKTESLNAGVAAAVMMYEAIRPKE